VINCILMLEPVNRTGGHDGRDGMVVDKLGLGIPLQPKREEGFMVFIVTGDGEHGPVSVTCHSAAAALERARALSDRGVRDVLIDAHGKDYAPADFMRLFVEPGSADAFGSAIEVSNTDE